MSEKNGCSLTDSSFWDESPLIEERKRIQREADMLMDTRTPLQISLYRSRFIRKCLSASGELDDPVKYAKYMSFREIGELFTEPIR